MVYTGTHDNTTTAAWETEAHPEDVARARAYLHAVDEPLVEGFIRAALASVSNTAIVPMQDWLGLGGAARMNVPSRPWATGSGGWSKAPSPRSWPGALRPSPSCMAGKLKKTSNIFQTPLRPGRRFVMFVQRMGWRAFSLWASYGTISGNDAARRAARNCKENCYAHHCLVYLFLVVSALQAAPSSTGPEGSGGGRLGHRRRTGRPWGPDWAGKLLRLAGVTVTVTGKENIPEGRPCVFVGNHRSYYDIPLVLTQLDKPHALVSKKEVAKIPLVRGWMRLLHCVFLDREDPRKAMEALNEAIANVKKGCSVIIFPEGTRNKGEEGSLLEFKGGAFRIATKTGAPLVPLAIHNSRDIMENNGGWMKPTHVTIQILPAIEIGAMTREQLQGAAPAGRRPDRCGPE